ncbi:MAG: hypothetical protein J6P03_05700 [Opitutales bacterium]|nr:hypothetical protein [Opitutales bacterium]
MKSFRPRRKKRKKKIADLLSRALQEENDFAAAYAPIVRRKFTRDTEAAKISSEAEQNAKRKLETFAPDTPEFESALKKIPPALLELLMDQFKAKPSALLRGAFQEQKKTPEAPAQEEAADEEIEFADSPEDDDSDDE